MRRQRSKDDEVREVVSQLDALMDELRVNVNELTAILGQDTPETASEGDRL